MTYVDPKRCQEYESGNFKHLNCTLCSLQAPDVERVTQNLNSVLNGNVANELPYGRREFLTRQSLTRRLNRQR